MNGTSVRNLALAEMSRHDRIAMLRAQMEGMLETSESFEGVEVPEELTGSLPGGGLPRRAVTAMSDSPALVLELIAHVTQQGGHAAVVGWPELVFTEVADAGGDLDKVIVVPDPGDDPLGIAAVLTEGIDLVIYRTAFPLELSPVRARPLLAKLRKGIGALVLIGTAVASPALRIDARISQYHGIGPGVGRIRGVELEIAVQAKASRSTTTMRVGAVPEQMSREQIGQGRKAQEASGKPHLRAV